MDLRTMRYMLAIAEHGHMTRAAGVLGVSQPALSAALARLEEELGAALFHRTGRGVEPTDAGRVFLEHAGNTLRAAELAAEAVRELVGLETGSIRVGAGATAAGYLLPEAIRAVQHEHPGLRFSIREAGSQAVAEGVISGELDLGIVTLPIEHPRGEDLMVVRTIPDELRLIVPPGHRLSGKKSFRWEDLQGEPVVAFEAGSAVRRRIDEAAAAHGVALRVVMELRSIESIVQMVRADIGVGFVSKHGLPEGAGLRPGGGAGGAIERELAVVRRRDRVPSHATAAFERALLASLPDASTRRKP
ncbi:MAG: LysR family transcriptional regulator [Phycisphaerales bacterium]|nr:LysR family transcriptional regulator [Planctomycetota bacterium]MCH8509456.1 LysR family transcriptional regulator [Phycisphaerales bacterium]